MRRQRLIHPPTDRLRVNVLRRATVHDDQVVVARGRVPERVLGSLQAPAERRFPVDPLTRIEEAIVDAVGFVEHEQHLQRNQLQR